MSPLELDLAAFLGVDRAREIIKRLASMGGRVYRVSDRNLIKTEVDLAVDLLSSGMTRADTREALIERASLSRRTAYRRIDAALKNGQRVKESTAG